MKRFVFLAKITLLILLLAGSVVAAITIDGDIVHVETDSYAVRFDKGVMTYIHNKHTDETYTHLYPQGRRGWTGLLFNSHFWKGENVSTSGGSGAKLVSATLVTPLKAELLYHQGGTDIRLCLAIDSTTNDLLIDMEGVSDTAGVFAMQWGLGYLDIENLSVIVPLEGGRSIDPTAPRFYHWYTYPSSSWEAQLAIAQGEQGGFYVRNTDNTFQYKSFQYDRLDDGVALNFGTFNQAPFDSHTTGQSKKWRFNTYAGDWRVPARIYRDWMEQAFKPRRLSDMPAWVEDITLVVGSARGGPSTNHHPRFLDRLAELVDPTKTLLLVGTWADGGDWRSAGDSHMPDYIPKPNMERFMEAADRHGFRVILYVIVHGFSPSHPLFPDFQQYQSRDTWTGELIGDCWDAPCASSEAHRLANISPASSEWRNLLIQNLKPVWEEYDIDGFFLDASHFVINDANGLIDGLNRAQGMALLHQELADAMPGAVFGGERLHEATFAYESFAQRPLLLGQPARPHPISAFLFSPFTHAIGYGPKVPDHDPALHHEVLRRSEVWDVISTLNIWGEGHLEETFVEVHKVLDLARTWEHRYGLNGDVNNDGTVNIMDLTLVSQNIGVMPLTHVQADINGDGLVNVLDLILVSNMFEAAR